MAEPSVTTETYETLRPLAFSIAYRMLGSVAEAEDVVQEGLLRLHRARGRRAPEGVRGHGRDAAVDRRAALGPRAPGDLRGPVAARADRHRLATRRRVGHDGAADHAREPDAGRARGVPAARRLRLRLRRDRGDRRQDARELPPARAARPPARRGPPGPLRGLARAAREARRALLRGDPRRRPRRPRDAARRGRRGHRRRRRQGGRARHAAAGRREGRALHARPGAARRAPRLHVRVHRAQRGARRGDPRGRRGHRHDGHRGPRRRDHRDALRREPGQAPPPR